MFSLRTAFQKKYWLIATQIFDGKRNKTIHNFSTEKIQWKMFLHAFTLIFSNEQFA